MRKTFSTVGMILGIVIVVMGLYLAFGFSSSYNGTSTSSYSFGADYYTEQYQATENAADNIMALGEYQEKLVDFSFKIIGLIVSAFGGVIWDVNTTIHKLRLLQIMEVRIQNHKNL